MTQMESDADTRSTITVRVDSELKEEYRDSVESMSGDLRKHIRDSVQHGDDSENVELGDELLNEGYRALKQTIELYTPPGRDSIMSGKAIPKISERVGIPSDAVKTRILKPLEKRAVIVPSSGRIHLVEGYK